jgi:hypothetical protein
MNDLTKAEFLEKILKNTACKQRPEFFIVTGRIGSYDITGEVAEAMTHEELPKVNKWKEC